MQAAQNLHQIFMADDWTIFPEGEEIEVLTENLCQIYGCTNCPGHVASEEGTPVLCIHDCHKTQ